MPKLRLLPVLAIAIAICAASGAHAETVVPPGNSAANQYTETFPTAGGEQDSSGHKKGAAKPGKTLGARNANRLESKGPEGKAVAKVAAETSPAPVAPPEAQAEGGGATSPGGGAHHEAESSEAESSEAESSGGQGGGAGGGGGGKGPPSAGTNGSPVAAGQGESASQPAGSSGLGEVIGQATGSSSSGKLGLLLPLVLIGAVIGSLFFLWRQRQRVA